MLISFNEQNKNIKTSKDGLNMKFNSYFETNKDKDHLYNSLPKISKEILKKYLK